MKREDRRAAGSGRREREAEPDGQTETTPAVFNIVAEDIGGVSGA